MKFSTQVEAVMTAEGISGAEITKMVRNSAITSLFGFNRRYHHWLFNIQNETVECMAMDTVVEIGTGSTPVYEEHEECSGRRCSGCNYHGHIHRMID